MKYVALFTLLTVAGAAACNQNPLGPTQTSASKTLAVPSAPSDGSDCVQEGENSGQCGSQVEDGTPDTRVPETPETGSPETPGTEITGQ